MFEVKESWFLLLILFFFIGVKVFGYVCSWISNILIGRVLVGNGRELLKVYT